MLEDTLVRREIAYQVIGGTKFYDRAEIKDALAYLIVLANPQDANAFDTHRQRPAARDRSDVAVTGAAPRRDARRPVWDAAAEPGLGPGPRHRRAEAIGRFMETMEALRDRAQDGVPVGDLLEAVLHETGYLEALEAERTIEAQGRIENLAELVEVAREFDATVGAAPTEDGALETFLQQVSLWPTPTPAATTRGSSPS